ncbi:UPF0538 protein C2orf76 homolog [Folsomia candida]|uniref:UPF0538 protein C2orf76 homolog n=1 Tax=Folsomia candida TaxID=158441 RepID=UPI000B9078E8|nr:UPF0538 protein C2orf76 homolog [Folsomia candida]
MEIDKDKKEATLTIRLIRSFVHTNWKPFVIHKIDLNLVTTEDLFKIIYASLPHAKLPPPFLSYKGFDTLKVETHRFGHKTNDPLINCHDDEKLLLKPGMNLSSQGVDHETEISFFNMKDYIAYKESKGSTLE